MNYTKENSILYFQDFFWKGFTVFFISLLFLSHLSYSQEKSFGTYQPMDFILADSTLIDLQSIIDKADSAETIVLEPGLYKGPVHIKKNGIVLDGQGKSIITGLDYQSVVYLEGNHIHIKNLVITNSGGSHDIIDCGVKITGSNNTVENCRIKG